MARLGPMSFELYLLCVAVLIGILGIAAPAARSRSIVETFPGIAQYIWYAGILIGGLLGLAGILGRENGIPLELAGLIILTGLTLSFGLAALAYGGLAAIPGALMFSGFSAACAIRAHVIRLVIIHARDEIHGRRR